VQDGTRPGGGEDDRQAVHRDLPHQEPQGRRPAMAQHLGRAGTEREVRHERQGQRREAERQDVAREAPRRQIEAEMPVEAFQMSTTFTPTGTFA
jgi:hypothetical protein